MRRTSRTSRALVWLTTLVIVLAVVDFVFGGVLRTPVRSVLTPVASVAASAGRNLWSVNFFSSRRALLGEVANLKTEVERMKERDLLVTTLLAENASLRSLSVIGEKNGMTVPVRSSFSASPYGTFLIGAGESDGVMSGDVVLSESGFVLGVVSDVQSDSALVTFAFAPGSTLEAVSGETGFTLSGRGLGNARAEVPREVPLKERDTVFAPALGTSPIGIIGRIESASSSAYATVFVYLPTNLNTVRFVRVIPESAL